MSALRPAALAFDAIAANFDERFGAWESVAAQRRAVRAALLQAFPKNGRILELGGGTGEDASWLCSQGFKVFLTDPSPAMVSVAQCKLSSLGGEAAMVAGEDLEAFAASRISAGGEPFDGAFSNFAPLNCVADLGPVARGLARLLRPGSPLLLVVFGTFCPGEMITEVLRGRPGHALRRFKRGEVKARLSGQEFKVTYHRRSELVCALHPWFALEQRIGIGVAVPPSAAEPWISRHPHVLKAMEFADRIVGERLAFLGDHVLYQFRRT